jgi:hypothetical protein
MTSLVIAGGAPAARSTAASPSATAVGDGQPVGLIQSGRTAQPPVPAIEIAWSLNRPLTWDDFRATPPTDGEEQAKTVYLLSYESRCRGQDFNVDVTAIMLPSQSWVKPFVRATVAGSARVLRHEQTHFNLTEVHARRMRRYFKELYNACGLPDERLREAVDRFVREESEAQGRYDRETQYGRNDLAQKRWDQDVADMLSSLATFSSEAPPANRP